MFDFVIDNDGVLERVGMANGIGETDGDFLSMTSAKIIDGYTTSHVSGGAVDFGGIFARESATTDWDAGP